MLTGTTRTDHWFFLCWLLISCWLFTSAFLTYGEYGDGYHAIVNGRYFYGDGLTYYAQRGPLAGLAMWPVELFIDWAQWNPVDIRPYHFYSALLHSLYLLGCWILLKSTVRSQTKHGEIAQFLALVAALLTVVFYGFAPFLNHDIIPGLLFLALLCLGHRWLNEPTLKTALWLIFIGTVATFIKQTCAIFWITLILYTFAAYLGKWDNQRVTGRKLGILLILAAVSGILSWLGWALWLVKIWPLEPIVYRPWLLIKLISELYEPTGELSGFSKDLYLRNLYNYGICATLLVIPGLISAFYNKESHLRMFAVCWLLGFAFMQLISFKEVRYLLFLAPLTAALISPIIQLILKQRIPMIILVALILIDQSRGLSLAAKQLISTAGINITRFIDAPDNKGRAIISKALSFVYMADSPLDRDPYHGIYHISALQLFFIYEQKFEVIELENPANLGQVGIRPGDRVYYTNTVILRRPPWSTTDNKPANSDHLLSISGDAAWVQLVRQGNGYTIKGNDDGNLIMFFPNKAMGQQMPVITSSRLTLSTTHLFYGDVREQESLRVIGVMVKGLCQAEQCTFGRSID